ncbi:DUF1700 domain-containing protein [Candidatus Stoquefichus massiliensis]|uniref:DUF1700 domain-containing protein n=1 Tax=Candidatus Stoquefichus massiliensis TaxID=1470350 RepID=UPI0004872D25|nr:DUF1700 domain-containing protein [Candidatus Stoquefichus massiliensis]
MDRKQFMRELEFLLQDISDEERQEALDFYENYFDEAGTSHEQKVISELGDPARVAAIIKDGLKGKFDDHIHAGSGGFSDDMYSKNFEVIDAQNKKKTKSAKKENHGRNRWSEMDSRDQFVLIILAVLACIPFSFSVMGIFKGLFGGVFGLFGIGFSIFAVFLCFIFGFWIITFIFHILAFILFVIGFIYLFSMPGAGLIYMGIACLLTGLGSVFGKIASWFFRDCIPTIVNAIADGLGKIFHPRGV